MLIIIITFFLSIPNSAASQSCPPSSCHPSQPLIRFPFSLRNSSCSYPRQGFTLSCNNQTLLPLPNSPGGPFILRTIDYAHQTIILNHPSGCLPTHLNLSGSPFSPLFFQNYTLFRCATSPPITFTDLHFIHCLSDGNRTVFATSSDNIHRVVTSLVNYRCVPMATLALPVKLDMNQLDIMLTWGTPQCGRCELHGGQCGNTTTAVECGVNVGGRRLPKSARYAIIVGAGIPAFLCLIGLTCCITSRMKQCCCRRSQLQPAMAVVPHPPTLLPTKLGLDGPTIESYPKTTLGESCRLPNPDDNICSICLSEYMPKQTLRSIPQCQHCFHAKCIDQWLRQSPSCPLCRNSPTPHLLPL